MVAHHLWTSRQFVIHCLLDADLVTQVQYFAVFVPIKLNTYLMLYVDVLVLVWSLHQCMNEIHTTCQFMRQYTEKKQSIQNKFYLKNEQRAANLTCCLFNLIYSIMDCLWRVVEFFCVIQDISLFTNPSSSLLQVQQS